MPNEYTHTIQGVEVFSAGVWNGDEYTTRDLDEMCQAFEDNKKYMKPALKLGHDDNQALLQRDGMPAAGWVSNLYRKGKKLFADFTEIPNKIYDLLKRGAYKKVSAEVWWNTSVNGKPYRRLLSGIALLGADMPGVMNLADIFERYSAEGGDLRVYESEAKSFTINIDRHELTQGDGMTDAEKIAKLEAELKTEKEKNSAIQKDYSAKQSGLEAQLEELKKNFAAVQEREAKAAEEAVAAKLETEVTTLVSEKLVTPAMKPYVKALLAGEPDEKKQYTVSLPPAKKGEEATEKKVSKVGLLKEILKLHSATHASVNTDEDSEENVVEEEDASDDQAALNEKITKYSKEHNVSYKEAYKQVMRDHEEADGGDEDEDDDAN